VPNVFLNPRENDLIKQISEGAYTIEKQKIIENSVVLEYKYSPPEKSEYIQDAMSIFRI